MRPSGVLGEIPGGSWSLERGCKSNLKAALVVPFPRIHRDTLFKIVTKVLSSARRKELYSMTM